MTFKQGINFRASLGYVTDGANEYYQSGPGPGGNYPTTTAQGNTVGWESTSYLQIGSRDRSSSVDARLAGVHYTNSTTVATYRIDLPSAGDYGIRLAAGDAAFARSTLVELFDTSSSLGVLASGSASAASFIDAGGTTRTAAAWPGSNTLVTKTFATTICRFNLGDTSTSNNHIAHAYVESAAPSGISVASAWTEDTDVFSATATVTAATVTASSAWTESNDTFAAASTVKVSGVASWSESSDAMSASVTQTVIGSTAWTDQSDTSSAAASVKLSASSAWPEDGDTFAVSATVTAATITASASWSESSDTFAATSTARIITAATWAEADDICAAMLTVGNGVNAAASWPEESDSFNASATVKSSASANWNESDDVTSAIATIGNVTNASVNWTEADDISNAICTVSASGDIAWVEASDVMSAVGHSDAMSTIKPNANLTAVGKPRIRSISGRQRIRSMT